jgi:hypothetical protein
VVAASAEPSAEVVADEACAAGDQNAQGRPPLSKGSLLGGGQQRKRGSRAALTMRPKLSGPG